ncbi:MAG: atpF [Verrucomicrobiales bacterium]|nr:atpF [Verrucomicrobiales bacterium]
MTSLFLLAATEGGGLADTAKAIAQTFGLNWSLFISNLISFCIVAAALRFFAYGPVQALLLARRQKIEEGLANAEKIKIEVARTEAQRQEILSNANAQANKMIEEARAVAAKVQEQETQKAIAAAEQIVVKAREAANADRARMLTELKREVGRLVVQTTTNVTGKILTTDDQKRLVEEAEKQLVA